MDLHSLTKYGKIIIFIMIMTSTALILANQAEAATTIKLNASNDAYVENTHASTNYGSIGNLRVGYESSYGIDRSYLKFNLTSIQGKKVNAASLVLYPVPPLGSPVVNLYWVPDNSWKESTITWNNKPAGTTLLGSKTPSGSNKITFNVTNYINTSQTQNSFLLMENGENDFVMFYSKDQGNADIAPYLQITYETASCNTAADTDCNGCVSLTEYNNFKYGYKNGLVTNVTTTQYNDIKYGFKNGLISC
jgi:hypothetical protein